MNAIEEACEAGLDTILDVFDKHEIDDSQVIVLVKLSGETSESARMGYADAGFDDTEQMLATLLTHASVLAEQAGLRIGPFTAVHGGRFS